MSCSLISRQSLIFPNHKSEGMRLKKTEKIERMDHIHIMVYQFFFLFRTIASKTKKINIHGKQEHGLVIL